MTPALEQIKALPELPEVKRYTVSGDLAYPVHDDPDGEYVDYDDHVAAMRAYALQALRDEAGEADLRQRLGEALTAVLTDPAAAPEPDWNDAREVDRIIDAILPAIAARPAPAAEAATAARKEDGR